MRADGFHSEAPLHAQSAPGLGAYPSLSSYRPVGFLGPLFRIDGACLILAMPLELRLTGR